MNLSLFLLTTFVLRINLLHIRFGFGIYSSVSLSRSCCAFWALGNLNINGDIFINDWLDFDVHSVVGCWYDERRFKFRCTKIAWTLIISTRHELFSSSLERRGEHHSQYDVLFFYDKPDWACWANERLSIWTFEQCWAQSFCTLELLLSIYSIPMSKLNTQRNTPDANPLYLCYMTPSHM